jgi:hypothetical protein
MKGHLTPEVKMVKKIVCDHVWDKLLPSSPISVAHSKWYVRKTPFVIRAQPLDENLLRLLLA